jgi:hypothetical protein
MNPVSEDIKDLLVKDDLGVFTNYSEDKVGIFISEQPSKPNNTITIYDVTGTADKVYGGGSNHFMHSAFQLRVRGTKYLEAWQRMEACRKALDRRGKFVVQDKVGGVTKYDNIIMDPEPLPFPKDSESRHTFTLNGIAFRQEQV